MADKPARVAKAGGWWEDLPQECPICGRIEAHGHWAMYLDGDHSCTHTLQPKEPKK